MIGQFAVESPAGRFILESPEEIEFGELHILPPDPKALQPPKTVGCIKIRRNERGAAQPELQTAPKYVGACPFNIRTDQYPQSPPKTMAAGIKISPTRPR